jgi:hypothetical protein
MIVLKITVCFALAIAFLAQAHAQTGNTAKPARTMASLMAEGYEISDIRIFPDKIWLRKPGGEALPFICDRGRVGSPAFDAYRAKRYDEISCLPTQ